MLLSSCGCDLFDLAIFLLQPFVEVIIDLWIHMAGLQIIHMPGECMLLAVDYLIGNAWIIRVDFETKCCDSD